MLQRVIAVLISSKSSFTVVSEDECHNVSPLKWLRLDVFSWDRCKVAVDEIKTAMTRCGSLRF